MIDTVAWVHVENGRILCARPRGKDVFYVTIQVAVPVLVRA
jgi:hypothetical protein